MKEAIKIQIVIPRGGKSGLKGLPGVVMGSRASNEPLRRLKFYNHGEGTY